LKKVKLEILISDNIQGATGYLYELNVGIHLNILIKGYYRVLLQKTELQVFIRTKGMFIDLFTITGSHLFEIPIVAQV